MKVDIVTSDDIKIYYTENFQGVTARYIIKKNILDNAWCDYIPQNIYFFFRKKKWMTLLSSIGLKAIPVCL